MLCCYQFSQILLLEVWLHLCVTCIVQVVLAFLHFAISVFQEVSVNSFSVTPFLMAIQAVTGLSVLVRRPVTGFVSSSLCLFTHVLTSYCCWTHRSCLRNAINEARPSDFKSCLHNAIIEARPSHFRSCLLTFRCVRTKENRVRNDKGKQLTDSESTCKCASCAQCLFRDAS